MALFKKKDGAANKQSRLFFATDVHGSERTFRKFLNCAKFYKVDHIIMGGDIMGKFLVPIVHEHDSHYRVTLQGTTEHDRGGRRPGGHQGAHRDPRLLPRHGPEDELHAMQADQTQIDAKFRQLARERIERWIALADERLAGTRCKWYVTGGNDDQPEVLTVFDEVQSEHVVNCEGRVVMFDDLYPMANCGYSNPTPWDTPREVDEDKLEEILEEAVRGHRRLHERHLQLSRAALRLHARRLPQARLVDRPALARSSSPACRSRRRPAARPCARSSRSTSHCSP